jgi:hypothetical protein
MIKTKFTFFPKKIQHLSRGMKIIISQSWPLSLVTYVFHKKITFALQYNLAILIKYTVTL